MCVGVKTSTKQRILIPVGNTAVLAKGYSVGLAAALKLELRGNVYIVYKQIVYKHKYKEYQICIYFFLLNVLFLAREQNKYSNYCHDVCQLRKKKKTCKMLS